jgi:Ribonuclease G/E
MVKTTATASCLSRGVARISAKAIDVRNAASVKEALREGQEMVQVERKSAATGRCAVIASFPLAGRYLVLMPL